MGGGKGIELDWKNLQEDAKKNDLWDRKWSKKWRRREKKIGERGCFLVFCLILSCCCAFSMEIVVRVWFEMDG